MSQQNPKRPRAPEDFKDIPFPFDDDDSSTSRAGRPEPNNKLLPSNKTEDSSRLRPSVSRGRRSSLGRSLLARPTPSPDSSEADPKWQAAAIEIVKKQKQLKSVQNQNAEWNKLLEAAVEYRNAEVARIKTGSLSPEQTIADEGIGSLLLEISGRCEQKLVPADQTIEWKENQLRQLISDALELKVRHAIALKTYEEECAAHERIIQDLVPEGSNNNDTDDWFRSFLPE